MTAVYVRIEIDALFFDFSQRSERKDLTADLLEIARGESPLDRSLRTDVHEQRCLYGSVRR